MVIGDWKATTFELPAEERAMAGAVACLPGVHQSRAAGSPSRSCCSAASPGKISTHTPDVCYPGAGYTLNTPRRSTCRYGPDEAQRRIPDRPGDAGGERILRPADLLELERLEGVVGAGRPALDIRVRAPSLQALRRPGDRGGGRRSRERSLQRFPELFSCPSSTGVCFRLNR